MSQLVVIGTPCFGGVVTHGYTSSLLQFVLHAQNKGVGVAVNFIPSDALITRARSAIVAGVLDNPKATHLLFIDADITFTPEQIERLIAFDKDVTAAMYPVKSYDWANMPARAQAGEPLQRAGLVYAAEHCKGIHLKTEGGFATAEYAGTGCLLIKRHVLEQMIKAYPETKFEAVHGFPVERPMTNNLYALFDCIIDPNTGHYLSEDYSFCRRWRQLGGDIWIDLESKLTHVGPHSFVGDATQRYAPLTKNGLLSKS